MARGFFLLRVLCGRVAPRRAEHTAGHLPGALHIELGDLPTRAADAPAGAVVHCGHGERAMTAAASWNAPDAPTSRSLTANRTSTPPPTASSSLRLRRTRARDAAPPTTTDASGRLSSWGCRENWLQFTLLVIVNICVGGLVGLERTTVPLIGSETFGLTSDLSIFSFIIAFGLTKAFANLAAGALTAPLPLQAAAGGRLAARHPRPLRPPLGTVLGLDRRRQRPVGLSQGLIWSMTVNMKIDLVGRSRRGLATG